jgi:enediyne biosynthesis protein E4
MIWPRRAGKSIEGPVSRLAKTGPRPLGLRLGPAPTRYLAALGLLLAIYGITTRLRLYFDPLSWTTSASDSLKNIVLPPPEDLGLVRANPTVPIPRSPFRFTEIAQSAGIDFVHVSGANEAKHIPTAHGSGVALFDADNDGKLDLYFANGTFLPVGTVKAGPNRLYRNLGNDRFQDATSTSGLGFSGYCHGIVVGDIDNDGDPDVFLCNYGPNVLYRNNGDGSFEDISKKAGIDCPGWSSSGAFLDYDNDGDLDLYVANYGSWRLPEDDIYCPGQPLTLLKDPIKVRVMCSPKLIRTVRHFLYRNNGDLTFTDVAESAGVGRSDGRGLGVVAADLNDDGRTDLYVANDLCPNFVFLNRGDGHFDDVTETSGAGYDAQGQTRAGMGVDAEDVNGDGRPDLFVTNYWNEPNSLFTNLGAGLFEERTRTSGMMYDGLPWVGWGCTLADFDNDGWPDCFVTNGQVDDNLELLGHKNPYAQPALLHQNRNGSRFFLATRDAGPYFDSDHVGRGVAYGDYDDDGDIDLVVSHKEGRPALLRNDTKTSNHWIRLRLEGTRSNRDAVGARLKIEAGEQTIFRQRKGGSSFASTHDPRILVGIGQAERAERITIRWPSGRVDQFPDLPAGADVRLREGAARPEVLADASRKDNVADSSAKPKSTPPILPK